MLSIEKLSKTLISQKGNVALYQGFDLKVATGSFVSIIGNNGTGKTTLLNMIAGIESVDSGRVRIHNKKSVDVTVGYVFQNYRQALYPWMTVMDNIAFPLKIKGRSSNERYDIVTKFCKKHNLVVPFTSYPYSLSGGQQQQVAIIRSWIDSPDLILMDEPFSSLDYHTSFKFQREILSLWSSTKTTVLFVSHSVDEAIYLSDRIIVLGGRPVGIIDDIQNPLPFTRDMSTLLTTEFNRIRSRILSHLENV